MSSRGHQRGCGSRPCAGHGSPERRLHRAGSALRRRQLLRQHQHPVLHLQPQSGIANADGFIGDYFGNITSSGLGVHVDEGTNPNHFQQQVVATVAVP